MRNLSLLVGGLRFFLLVLLGVEMTRVQKYETSYYNPPPFYPYRYTATAGIGVADDLA